MNKDNNVYCTCDGLLAQLTQANMKYDKNIVDLMKDKIILDVRTYEQMIRNDERYSLEYKRLRDQIEEEYKSKYAEKERKYEDEMREWKRLYNDEYSRYCSLLDQTKKYRQTSWWKRNFGK